MSIAKKSVKWLVALFVIFALILTASVALGNVARASAEPEAAAADTEIALSVIAKGAVSNEAYPDLLSSASDRTVTVEYYFDIPAAIENDLNTEMKFDIFMTLPDNSKVKPTNIEVNTAVASAVTMDALTNSAEEGYLDDAETAATEFGITLKSTHTMSELRGFTKSGTTYTLGNYFFKATYTVPASTDGVFSFGFGATSEVPANEALDSEAAIIYVPAVTNVTTDTVMDGIDDVTAVSTGIFYVRSYIDVPVAVSGLIFNAQQQTAIVDKDGYAYVIGDLVNDIYPIFYHDGWPTGFSLVPETYIGGVEAQQSSGTFALIDKDITIWRIPDGNDGYTYSTDNYTVNWEIAKRSITAPVSAGTTYTYNGQEQSFAFSEDPLTDADYITITGTPQTNVGEYTVTAALTYPASTYWAADTTDTADKEYDFIINPALITVPTPANETYTYNGTAQSFQWASTPDALITITGTPQTNAGNYTITASIPANYAWNDEGHTTADKTFPFVIAKMQIAIPEEDDTVFVYTGSAQNYTVAASDYYTVTGTPQTNAGEYEVTISLDDTDNTEWSDGTTEDIVYDFVIAKVQITKPTPLDNVQYVYDSYNKQFMLDVVSAETGYYTISNNIRKNAGTQTVTVSLKDKTNTEWADGTTADLEFTFTVQRRPVNISVSADAASHVYGNTPANVSISMTGAIDAFSCSYKVVCVDGEAPYAEYTPTQFNEGLNAGHYTLNPVYNDINGNYDVTVSEPFSYEVIKREITIPTAISGLEYTGSAQVGVTKTDGSFYTLYSGSDEETAVGNYSATYRLNSTTNCYWAGDTTDVADKTVEWSIAKKSITKPSISASFKIYNGTSQSYSGSGTGYTFTGSGTNAGEYPVTVTLTDKDNSVWAGTDSAEDYNEADKLVIAQKTVKLTLAKSADSSVYGNSIATITAGINPDYAPINTADIGTLTYTAKNFQTNVVYTKAQFETVGTAPVGNYILTAACSIDNPNYSVDAQTLPYEITKRQIEIPVLNQDYTSFVYTGSERGISFFSGSLDDADYFTVSGINSATNVGNYTYTATLNDATNCEWADSTTAAKNYDWSITTRYITVPTVDDDTFDYDGTAKQIIFSNVDTDYVDVTYDSQSAIGVYTDTTTVALKAAHAGNIAWDEENYPTAAKTYTLTIEVVEVNFTIVPIFNNTEKTGAATAQNVLTALPAATTYRWFKFTGYTFGGNAVSNVSLDMEGETVYANYSYNVGAGDADGDGVISSADVILLKRWNVGLDRAKKIADAATAWAKTDDSSVTSAVLYTALDANNNGAIRSNDVVAVREALATGRTYKVIVAGGIIKVAKANRVTVNSYEDLLGNIRLGNPVTLGADIDAANEIFNEDSLIPVDIDLGDHRLTVKGFTLNTAIAGATLKINNGTLYTVTGIAVTAPNGNVIVDDVNGYSYDGTVVNLSAYSESLHIASDVAFYIYKAQDPVTNEDYADVHAFVADVYPEEETVETIAEVVAAIKTLANTRMGETEARMQDIATIKADTTKTEAQKAEDINALDVKKAIIEVPVDTHVVVEEEASLSVEKLVVKAQSDENAPAVTTFAIEVKNAAAEKVTVDVSEVKEIIEQTKTYVVEEIAISGASSQVEIVKGDNTAADVKKYVAQIGTTSYETLQAAINAAQNADTIKLIADVADGTGIAIPDTVTKTITIDFNGKTYNVKQGAVGSPGTVNQVMHWSRNSTVTLKNGTFTVDENVSSDVIMGMQNYATLTVTNMVIDLRNVPTDIYPSGKGAYTGYQRPFFNTNFGSLTMTGSTVKLPATAQYGVYFAVPGNTITNSTIEGTIVLDDDEANVKVVNSTFTSAISYFAGKTVINDNNLYRFAGEADYVAKIGAKGYLTFDAALADAQDDDVIDVLANVSSVNGYLINKDLEIDLNGNTITVETGANVNNRAFKITSGTLTIYNGEIKALGGGTTSSNGYGCYGAFRAEVGTKLIAHDLTLRNSRPWGLNVKLLGATAELTNVDIISAYGGGIEVTDDEGADGTVTGYAKMVNCSVTQSGYFDHCSSAVSVSGASTLDVYSTDYTAEYGVYVFSSGGTINIYGGTFTADEKDVFKTTYDAQYDNDAVINVYDGTFYGTYSIGNSGHEFLYIYGGSFDHDPTAYVAEGCDVVTSEVNEVTMYTVVGPTCVANAAELNAALAADVETIVLADDIEVTAPVVVDHEVVLNMNGKTIYNTTDIWYGNNWSLISVRTANGDLTIIGDGTISAKENDCYAIDVQDGATLVIEDGTYVGNISAVYICDGGHVTINGGEYSILQLSSPYNDERYLLNCLDAYYTAGTATFTVTGGTFHGFNPADNASEGPHTNYVAEDYISIEDDGVWTVTNAVASVNGVGFTTLEAAIAAAESGDTVTILSDIALADSVTITSTLILDLNGYTISSTKTAIKLGAGANVTINDSSEDGTGAIICDAEAGAVYGILLKSSSASTLVVNGGYIFGKSSGIYTNTNAGTVTINDGYIKSTGSQGFTLGWGETYLVMNGGIIESESTYAIWTGSGAPATDPSTVTINGGALITPKTEGAICVGAGNVVINGGDFTDTNRIFHNRATAAGHNFTFVINGGTFAAMTYTNRVNYVDSEEAVDAYIADGYAAFETVLGYYAVMEDSVVVINSFEELADAIDDVNAGTLVDPVLYIAVEEIAFEYELMITKSVTILGEAGVTRFSGYNVTGDYDDAIFINTASANQTVVIKGITFDHVGYYADVENEIETNIAILGSAMSYSKNCAASTSLYLIDCTFWGIGWEFISFSSSAGCAGNIYIEGCEFDATDRIYSTVNLISFYGKTSNDISLNVDISGCTFKNADKENEDWPSTAIGCYGNTAFTIDGCTFINCEIAITIDNTYYPMTDPKCYYCNNNAELDLGDDIMYINCETGVLYYAIIDAADLPAGATLVEGDPVTVTNGYVEITAAEYHLNAAGNSTYVYYVEVAA